METGLTISSMAALFAAMLVLAYLPSVSVLAVAARAAASGFSHGVAATLGIILGDILFILLAVFGLSAIAEHWDGAFVWLKYLGGAYLIWIGITLWRQTPQAVEAGEVAESSLWSSFVTGLLITLADQKAILFYLGFFPAFLDLTALSAWDIGVVMLIAIVSIAIAKLTYAYLAHKAGVLIGASASRALMLLAGGIMVLVGVVVMLFR